MQKKSNENCRILLIALFKFHQTLVQKFKGRFLPKSDIFFEFSLPNKSSQRKAWERKNNSPQHAQSTCHETKRLKPLGTRDFKCSCKLCSLHNTVAQP